VHSGGQCENSIWRIDAKTTTDARRGPRNQDLGLDFLD
jgi:hypothetical protein